MPPSAAPNLPPSLRHRPTTSGSNAIPPRQANLKSTASGSTAAAAAATTTANATYSSNSTSASTSTSTSALAAHIAEKRAELDGLRQLRDLSAALAAQMEALGARVETLDGGTEAVAVVLSNWHNVLRAINMASAKIPKPAAANEERDDDAQDAPLPQMLVRIPVDQAEKAAAGGKKS